MSGGIGTLGEGSLHADLKRWLALPGDVFEQPVDGYVVDLVRGDLLVEVQTGGFSPLKEKLADLLQRHRVRLVVPVARTRFLVRTSEDGATLSKRRSPKQGRIEDVFERLVSFPHLVGHARFELELLVTAETEVRAYTAGVRRRQGWALQSRALVDVLERRLVRSAADLAALLPAGLDDLFTTADVAVAAKLPRELAQQMLYCLHAAGALERAGKIGNAHRYRRVA